MSTDQLSDKDIFNVARRLDSAQAVFDYLDQVCGDDSVRRERILKLIQADMGDSFLEKPLIPLSETVASEVIDQRGETIGPYKLREQIGEGGMGVVWAAERKTPIRQKVALKVIKPGMDSKQVLARFEAEKHALSLMNHPNIAKVLDAGTTEQGRPYFVMELIRGIPITDYCDANRLSIPDRLKLFIQACRAVQHAHQKAVIHRDIKPSNVLVSETDGEPIVKVIDFGVAKALDRSLTDSSIYTGVFQAIGTLAYMSPEQAGLSIEDTDTRADVYSLGVLLYELLTGSTPVDKKKLSSAALDEACRIIREEDPPKPSVRTNTLGEKSERIHRVRRIEPGALSKSLRGDVDAVVMMSLQKDRNLRYESAAGLAEDVACILDDREVRAREPNSWYRVKRFARRNRIAVTTGSLAISLLLALVCLGFVMVMYWRKEFEESEKGRLTLLLNQAIQMHDEGNYAGACDAYQQVVDIEQQLYEEHSTELLQHKLWLAQALGETGEFGRPDTLFRDVLSALAMTDHESPLFVETASKYRDFLVDSIIGLLETPNASSEVRRRVSKLASQAKAITDQAGLDETESSFRAYSVVEYLNGNDENVIGTCKDWLSLRSDENCDLAMVLIASSHLNLDQASRAHEWLTLADNIWIGGGPRHRSIVAPMRDELVRRLMDAGYERTKTLDSSEEIVLVEDILEAVPESIRLRKMRAYLRFQLGRWEEAKSDFESLCSRPHNDDYIPASKTLFDIYLERPFKPGFTPKDLKERAKNATGPYQVSTLSIVSLLDERNGLELAENRWVRELTRTNHIAGCLLLYRLGEYDDVLRLLETHGGVFVARDCLAHVIRALCLIAKGDLIKAEDEMKRADALIDAFGIREKVPRPQNETSYYTSVIWLEPIVLMREAKEKLAEARILEAPQD